MMGVFFGQQKKTESTSPRSAVALSSLVVDYGPPTECNSLVRDAVVETNLCGHSIL